MRPSQLRAGEHISPGQGLVQQQPGPETEPCMFPERSITHRALLLTSAAKGVEMDKISELATFRC